MNQFGKSYNAITPQEHKKLELLHAKTTASDRSPSCSDFKLKYPTTAQLTSPTIWRSNCENYYSVTPCGQTDCDKEFSFGETKFFKIRSNDVATQIYLELKGDNYGRRADSRKTYILIGYGNALTASYIKATLSAHGDDGKANTGSTLSLIHI